MSLASIAERTVPSPVYLDESGHPQDFEVEQVLQKRKFGRETKYLIKWKGWTDSHNTWEPLEHLNNCHELLQQFEQQHPTRKSHTK